MCRNVHSVRRTLSSTRKNCTQDGGHAGQKEIDGLWKELAVGVENGILSKNRTEGKERKAFIVERSSQTGKNSNDSENVPNKKGI